VVPETVPPLLTGAIPVTRGPHDLSTPSFPPADAPATRSGVVAGEAAADDGRPRPREAGCPEVAGYEVLGLLGRGGMGVVYKARQTALKRVVALKMILAGEHAGSEQLARFRAEAEAVARLQHPNVVQVYEIGDRGGLPFFSLEFMEGGSLDRKLRGMPQPARETAELVRVLARAMHAAHQRGIVHRDLKPANVLLAADGTPKITDFGLAKRLDDVSGRTHSGAILGTPSYMAPEQAGGRLRDVGPPADVYALGAILYEALTGRPPFLGESMLDTLEQVCGQQPVAPSRLQPKTPRDLETICLRCLRKEPARRYATAEDLAEDLRRFLDGEPIKARRVGSWERAAKWAWRRPAAAAAVALGVAAAALLITAGVAGSLYRQAELRRQVAQFQESQRQADLRSKCQRLLLDGQHGRDRHDWEAVKQASSEALTMNDTEPTLADLRDDARRLYDEAARELAAARAAEQARLARQQAEETYRAFFRQRDEALFYLNRDVVTDAGLGGGPARSRDAARRALALLGVDPAAGTGPRLEGYEPDEQERLRQGCYEVLLILAEATASSRPGQPPAEARRQAEEALRLLDRADVLGYRTRSAHERRARYLALLGDEAKARGQRARAAAVAPALALDRFLLGYDAWFGGRESDGAGWFRKTLAAEPDHFWARYYSAVAALKARKPAEAQSHLTVCLREQPGFVWGYVLRGSVNAGAGDFEDAEADFARALALLDRQPDDDARYVVLVNRGVLRLLQAGAARGSVPADRTELDRAVDDFGKAIALRPGHYHARMNLGLAHKARQDWDAACRELGEAIRLYRREAWPAGPDATLARLYRERAHVRREQKDLAGALEDFGQAIREQPGGAPVAQDHLERASILILEQHPDEALRACDAALAAQPDYADADRVRAEVLFDLQRFDEATRSYDRYVEREGRKQSPARPLMAKALREAAMARSRLGRYAESVDDLTRALALDPADARTRALRGWAYLVSDAPRLALRDFEELLRLDAANGDAYAGRGYARAKIGQYRPAVADAGEAVRLGPRTPRQLYNAARVFALAVGAIDAEPAPRARAGQQLRYDCQQRALSLLAKALAETPAKERPDFWADYVKADPALQAIRPSPGFARLAAQYDRASP
jgi:tetratricopeptide (TPR) repeat protein/tRNA A-37 threonylcarbamoyl transferase component Bud32